MLKITDGDKTISAGPYIYEDEILADMTFLREQIKEIDNYLDRSLFFQNPLIIEGWLQLIRTISKIKKWEISEDDEKWEERTETYVAYLLEMREIRVQYQNICRAYYEKLKELMDFYGGWLAGNCVRTEGIDALYADQYEKDLNDVDDIIRFLEELNEKSQDARSNIYITLSDVHNILVSIMNRGANIVFDLNPSEEDFAKAIDADLREWTLSFDEEMFDKMEEEMSRYYMENRTDKITPGHWSKMLDADEDALRLAIRRELAKCDDVKQEHWGEDRKVEMDENCKLMQQIYSSCKNKELFDLSKAEKVQPFIEHLTPENLSMFYDIIVRRSLIQCEMFPELKTQHDEWLKKDIFHSVENSTDNAKKESDNNAVLPAPLCSEMANEFKQKLMKAGMIDDNWQPVALSRTDKGELAMQLAIRLGINDVWQVFGKLWNFEPEQLRSAFNTGRGQKKNSKLQEKIRSALG